MDPNHKDCGTPKNQVRSKYLLPDPQTPHGHLLLVAALIQAFTYNAETGQLQLLSNPNKCIDLYGGNATNGAQLEIWYV